MSAPTVVDPTTITLASLNVVADNGSSDPDDSPGVCGGCGDVMEGEIVKPSKTREYVHASCYARQLSEDRIEDAWRSIALHVAASPSRHSAATVRAVITNLLAMQGVQR